MKKERFQVYKDKKGEWRWRLKSRNGRIVCQGESYATKQNALRAIKAIKRIVKEAK